VGDGGYARGPAALARLNEILALAITTEELPPELRGVVELGDEVLVEFAADEVERFLLVDPGRGSARRRAHLGPVAAGTGRARPPDR
jgi:hypothetical protein